ncbi:TRAP transporter permease [Oceanobacillus halophilus]|uniref:TRAP transporter fused permease subunit n=1 Tax=Oceanobacillus halophilus TaxID=930130 RepID=A0A494ZV22_9BACI|nr:TRAP transporter fused permease subunit [Oceanobacillus halophilus]RKQ29656.1 TRAP transporter fused permease subunit [Oceanobacillus halophilus]
MDVGKILKGWFYEGYRRQLTGFHVNVVAIVAFSLAVFQIWSMVWGKMDPINQMSIHLSFILALSFLVYGFSKKNKPSTKPTIIDYFSALIVLAAGIYFTIHAERIAVRIPIMDPLSGFDILFGLVFVILTIEAARRTIGLPIIAIVFLFFAYALWGHHLPGIWGHRQFSAVEFLDELAFSFNGLWGSPISVAASIVFMYMLFGAFLKKAGAGEFFFKLSSAIAGRSKGGAAKVAVLASAFFGSISGSPTANVVTTGSFTIPVSKKTGYKSSFSAAIEAAASTGGSILPPIMGSSAFLMAAVTQLSYGTIVMAALIPGILYYISLITMVHFEAMRLDLPRTDDKDIPKIYTCLKEGWYYFIPLIVLVIFLFQGYSASRTGFYGILAIIAVSWFGGNSKMGLKEIVTAMVEGAKSAIPVTTACAAAGLVIAGIMSTGLGGKLTSIVLGLTEGMLIPTLILIMFICIILGMGMPVAAAYILTAMLAAPALIELGVSVLSAHLFIVYFSIFSAITPPVAVAAFAAAGIANANPNRVGLEAVRLGLVGFIVPYMFVLEPSLLMDGSIWQVSIAFVTACIGVIALATGTIGWLVTNTSLLERITLLFGGLMTMFPGVFSDGVGLTAIVLIYFLQKRRIAQMEQVQSSNEIRENTQMDNSKSISVGS